MSIAIVFIISYYGFVFGYPLLQLWTLVRCREWWRAIAVICMVPALPLYIWAFSDWLHPKNEAGLMSVYFAGLGLIPMLISDSSPWALSWPHDGQRVETPSGEAAR